MSSPKSTANIDLYRHSLAHLMAAAIQKLWPSARFGVGPSIDNGFYYDIEIPNCELGEKDLSKIEKQMSKLISANLPFVREEMALKDALKFFEKINQPYKVELLKDLEAHGTTVYEEIENNKKSSVISRQSSVVIYKTGDFIDLCRGPHVASAKDLAAISFKLQKIAGAYWRGNEKNPMLTRIYGLAFEKKAELENYLFLLAEAEKRDHRKLGKELDLFHLDEMVGLGLPLWHPKGALLWRLMEDFWYAEHLRNGYDLVRSPHIGNKLLWETSGHWGFYAGSMYPPLEAGQSLDALKQKQVAKETESYLLKPMNCPFHVRIYKNNLHSYRELPFRWAETGTVYRYEKKGELSGLVRVRGFTQDDAHIICRADQVEDELKRVIDFILFIYQSFGFNLDAVNVYLSLRDPDNKDKYAGADAGWELTETLLRKIAQEKKLNFKEEIGEAAFYGPKLDFKIKDVLGREWQCSTLQFDFNLPERFDMTFVNSEGAAERPYMLHRALFGSFERFIGLLIEHYAGAFPLWLAPVQIAVITVGSAHIAHAEKLKQSFKLAGLRPELYDANETVGNKIRKAINQKIPYLLVIGDKEMASKNLHVRRRGSDTLEEINQEKFLTNIYKLISDKSINL